MLIPGSRCSKINSLWWRTCLEKLDNLSSCHYPRARLVRFSCTWHVHIMYDSYAHCLCASRIVLVHVTCVIPMHFSYTQDFPLDDSSLCLGTEMVAISRMDIRVFFWDWKREWKDLETLTPKGVSIGFLLGLSDLSLLWAWVT